MRSKVSLVGCVALALACAAVPLEADGRHVLVAIGDTLYAFVLY